ncbi:J domain-containing protein [Candidatus Atelocyanobacterium thalassae]|uniref:DnaJ-class molecular chaperone with C-terminal Zn finger domain n=2 Tax=Candidatus Atelocyanobacterium thalassae TaxID=713887 RepID=A0A086CHN0_9CHRO|nr:J domain-containing protein [Candidatus Atelocyanobacterium thalassa]KFF41694.1 MAG: DnaJ-class molecular chaperone with C-terminal Zn finger domain [Candidatus Atelocyanobacterium thalassa isolate SIO64986]BDA39219.1 chaperone protein DnaJ [cyanobacterium endosymbiont of Braarudosphaera bigelowii]
MYTKNNRNKLNISQQEIKYSVLGNNILQNLFPNSYYAVLGIHPSTSILEIRKIYRELSKLYHPDTTVLSPSLAKLEFQRLNESYQILSNPQKRLFHDIKIGYISLNTSQNSIKNSLNINEHQYSSSAYLDPYDRSLSGGEIFAVLTLGLTILGCLILSIIITILRKNGLTLHMI